KAILWRSPTPLDQFLALLLEEAQPSFAVVTMVFWIRHRKTRSRTEEKMSEKSLPTVRRGPQLYPDDSGSWDAKSVQQIPDCEYRQYAPALLWSPHSSQDPAMFPFEKVVGRPGMVPTALWQYKKVDRDMSQFVLTMPLPIAAAIESSAAPTGV
ncbi:hypothetical protein BGZ74_011536, partial [Mortierella antarctica]